ncbi:hypothetical protein WN944_001506 [Citrus x changshan-huyou]|uniref:Uncharacterized protein n=1 Tax=Citrus x changshan-huyou TaxID=2935761 RepID=A0AAP0QQU2_9ROSI
MGRIFVVELDGRSYRCKFCRTHLALPEDLVSRVLNYKIRTACEIMNGVESRNLHLKDDDVIVLLCLTDKFVLVDLVRLFIVAEGKHISSIARKFLCG